MSSMISALVKRPGEIPRHVNISNSLEALQRNVEGFVEVVTLIPPEEKKGRKLPGMVVICNEEGRLRDMPYNCTIWNQDYVGPIIICGCQDDEFIDLPLPWGVMKCMFPSFWEKEAAR